MLRHSPLSYTLERVVALAVSAVGLALALAPTPAVSAHIRDLHWPGCYFLQAMHLYTVFPAPPTTLRVSPDTKGDDSKLRHTLLFVFRGWVVLRKTDEFGCVLHSRRRPFKGTPPQHDRRRENV